MINVDKKNSMKKQTTTGIIKIHRKKAILETPSQEEIPIDLENLNGAFHGDSVKISLFKSRNHLKPKVIEIVKRHKKTFVGNIQLHKNEAFFSADDRKIHTNFYIAQKDLKHSKNSDKVLVTLKGNSSKNKKPQAKVLKIIGKKGTHQTEIHSILENYELPYSFSEKILKESQKLNTKITNSEIKKRKDFRNILTFTIDPEDAKDFDDALSFEVLENGIYSIGVHIADVSHYVKENSILDKEAYLRANSVYLVDRVVPMLPEILSNEICSLRPREEKLTFSAVFKINEKAEILETQFKKTIIYSDERLTYEQAQNIIEKKDSNISENIKTAILKLDTLAQKIRKKRMQKGAISFDKTETKFKLDKENNPVEVLIKTSQNAHKLIEEFMLLANKKVAEWVGKKIKKTLIYRIHDFPDGEKLQELKSFVRKFGYTFHIDSQKNIAKNINQLLEESKENPEANIIQTLTIRCMSKAIYSTENIGHYGLAFDFYTHFTSPIRRYCDLVVHRLLENYLKKSYKSSKDYPKKSKHISEREVLAVKAERESQKYMQIKYMQNQKNKIFEGMISGLTDWGIYVEIVENKCEGMILLKDIKNDHYIFDKPNHIIKGRSTKKTYQLGDKIFIKLKKANLERKHLDFYLVQKT